MEIADKKKILLIDDHPLLRKGIGMIIRQKLGQYHQIGEAANSQEAYSMVLSDDWDVVVLDINIPGRDGIDLLKDFHRDKPDLPILMLSAYPIKEFAIRCIKAGASGYINKQSPADDIAEAIAALLNGGKYITSEVESELADQLVGEPRSLVATLSNREFEVFRKIAGGMTVSQIGNELSLSVKTISTFRSRILEKLNLENNAQIMQFAIRHELLDG
ncbi:MAG: two-component system invasion response regulator UvrY [Kiritimatiellia bacterium]|jgi:two-component system, NarL family, invasion response regulator UvrY